MNSQGTMMHSRTIAQYGPRAVAPLRRCASLFFLALLAGPAWSQQDAKVPDPDPELERQSFQVADGFEVNLFAADPLLAKPIAMSFDAAGRLWVACSAVYPQIKPGQKADDKVIILEDTKGAGKADKVTVFADGLLIPTGIEPGDGGCYVADSTELVHLSSGKGDGKADRRRVVLSGFGTEDTHHMLHSLRWGPDGMLYMNQSIYIHSHIETPHGVRRLNAGGVWRFRPETMQLDVFLHGFCNPWGHHFDRWGQSFVTDGAYGEGINWGLPGASYVFTPGATRIMWGLNPGSPKHCGLEIVGGRHLPDDWQGNMITNDFRGHRVCRFVVSPDGAGYASKEMPEVIKTNHGAFRPIDVKMGPDGAIYIADWYNPIIQHGEVDFRDPRRDHVHGRIWRITAKGRPVVQRPKLVDAPTDELLDHLKAPEGWTRHFAKRVLKERGQEKVLTALKTWVQKLDSKEPEYEHHQLEALWTYQSLDVVEPKLLDTLLHAREPRARAAAVRVVDQWGTRLHDPLGMLAERVGDEHPQVRLEAVRAIAHKPGAIAHLVALQALDRPMDRFLDYALWLTIRELSPSWLPEFQKGRFEFGNPQHMLFALQAVNSPAAVQPLLERIKSGKIPDEQEAAALNLVASLGNPKELDEAFELTLDPKAPARRRVALLTCLGQAARQRQARPDGDLARLAVPLRSDNEAIRAVAARLVGLWKLEAYRADLLALARDPQTSEPLRRAAFEGLTLLGGDASRTAFESLADKGQSLAVRRQAVIAFAALDVRAAAKLVPDVLAVYHAENDPADVIAAFVQRKEGAAALAAAFKGRKLPADVAKLAIRAARATGRDQPALVEVLTEAGGLTPGPRVLAAGEMRQLVADVAKLGDPARGEQVYRRKDQSCMKCHAIAGAGGQVGPDLSSVGASAQVDYLIESILQPSKAIKENYHALLVVTKDGKQLSGIPVRQTNTELVLRDAEDREVAVPLKEIEAKEQAGSLMPEGLADTLTRGELIDLVRFLSELGKVGPYSISKARVVRRWQALEPTRPAYRLVVTTSFAAAAGNDPALSWVPAYSTVAGLLPPDDLPRFESKGSFNDTAFVRCQLDVSTGGKVKLLVNSAKGLTAWLDGTPLEAKEEMLLDLKQGLHTLTLAVAVSQRREPLRVELDDVPGSAARTRVVGGK